MVKWPKALPLTVDHVSLSSQGESLIELCRNEILLQTLTMELDPVLTKSQ